MSDVTNRHHHYSDYSDLHLLILIVHSAAEWYPRLLSLAARHVNAGYTDMVC